MGRRVCGRSFLIKNAERIEIRKDDEKERAGNINISKIIF